MSAHLKELKKIRKELELANFYHKKMVNLKTKQLEKEGVIKSA